MEDEEVSTNGTLVKMITSMNNQTTSTSTSLICTKCEPLYQTDVCLCNDDPYEAIQEVNSYYSPQTLEANLNPSFFFFLLLLSFFFLSF